MLLQGRSMSGNERNCCFLNTLSSESAGRRFATVSAISGLDFADDGQAAARVDLDHDGDLDLLLTNRNAPRLRFMRNNAPRTNDSLRILLQGNGTDTNRDAINARVTVTLESDDEQQPVQLVKSVYATDGFLSQSSRWLHFGLGQGAKIAKVQVQWPNRAGTIETFETLEPNQRYKIVQGTGSAVIDDNRLENIEFKSSPTKILPTDLTTRIPLLHRFPAPELKYTDMTGESQTFQRNEKEMVLVNLWSTTCVPCVKELNEFVERYDELKAAGIKVLALSIDDLQALPEARKKSAEMASRMNFSFDSGMATATLVGDFERMHKALIKLEQPLPMPTSFLIDRNGRLNTIYKGTVDVDTLLADADQKDLSLHERYVRSASFPGTFLDLPDTDVNERMERVETSALIQLGKDYFKERQFAKAETVFKDTLKQIPESASVNNELALVYDAQGKNQQAANYFLAALEIKPDNVALNINAAQSLIRLGKFEEAAGYLDRAIELEPENANAHYNRGMVYSTQNDIDREKASYERAIEIQASHPQALYRMGRMYEIQSNLSEARSYYEKALAALPARSQGRAAMQTSLGRVLTSAGENALAHRLLVDLVRRFPRYAEGRYQLGRVLLELGQRQEARNQFLTTLQLNSNHQGALQAIQQLR